jgi:cytochrome c-type biogenesis protein CcmF
MLANVGYGAMLIAFLVSIYGIIAAVYGETNKEANWVESARSAMRLTFPLLTISSLALVLLLVNYNFEVEYVASVTSRSMPTYLRITALWGGQAGSLLFWSWLMAGFASAVTLRDWRRDREFLPWVIVVSLFTLAFFLLMVTFFENPFAHLWQMPNGTVVKQMLQPGGARLYIPVDGNGLNPLLRHPGMVFHPPMLYLGFVSFVIPFAFAIASLVTGRSDDRWIRITRRWTLWAWLFLSLGLILGGRWAYDVLGWGGYWGWDPVEIAALLPWLVGTPFLHSVMIQEKRGMLKRWNMVLIILTYDSMILGTFLTRSGVLSSVHAFAQSAIGPLFFIFIGITMLISIYLLAIRWDSLKSEGVLTSLISRESLFLVNNMLFLSIFVICFWGIIYPLVSEVFTGQKVTLGPPYYEAATAPLWLALLLLMGIAPLSAWGASTLRSMGRNIWKPGLISIVIAGLVPVFISAKISVILTVWFCALVISVTVFEFTRASLARHKRTGENIFQALFNVTGHNRRRYGGYIIHFGVVLMAIGIMGLEVFQTETQGSLPVGGELTLGDYTMRYKSLAVFDTPDNRNVARAVVDVYKNGQLISELYPRRDYFYDSKQSMTIPGLRSTLEDDFYVILVDWQEITTQNATFKVYHNPLVNWLWLGSFVFIFGTLVAAWPEQEVKPVGKEIPYGVVKA